MTLTWMVIIGGYLLIGLACLVWAFPAIKDIFSTAPKEFKVISFIGLSLIMLGIFLFWPVWVALMVSVKVFSKKYAKDRSKKNG